MSIFKCKLCLIVLSLLAMGAASAQSDSFACDYATDIDQDNDGLIEICDLEGLDAIRYQLDGTGYRTSTDTTKITTGCKAGGCNGYELTGNLDLTEMDNWLPINTFTGIFEGNDHAISNLKINRPNTDGIGLFGSLERGAEINNIGLFNVDVKGYSGVGSLVGWNSGRIANSHATGSVDGDRSVGSLVGWNSGRIANSYATGSVDGDRRVGGLVGQNDSGSITDSYAIGFVDGNLYVGGLVGRNDTGSITNSYATSSVDGWNNIGGLVGRNGSGSIADSYATGSIYGNSSVGGLVGSHVGSSLVGSIINSYAIGSVGGNENIGGLVGWNGSGSVANSYWNTETSGISISAGGTSKTTVELQSPTTTTGIYSMWSSDDWDFGSASQYPVLKDENGDLLSPALRYGLSRLRLSEGNLSPDFIASLPHYIGTVVNSTGTIQLTPTAINPAARIRIKSGKIDGEIASGSTSSEITLNPIGITTITIIVINNGATIKYDLQVNYYRFSGNIDKDGDGLIEVDNSAELHAIRHQADGTGYRKTSTSPKVTTGCPTEGCRGYELTGNLDLSAVDNWLPINAFTGVFEGGGHTISNLKINRPDTDGVGLFGDVESGSEINNIGLLNVDIKGNVFVGGLVGRNNFGTIANSYAIGSIDGYEDIGGLVGENNFGSIINSYAGGSVYGSSGVGGLVGENNAGSIINSYAGGSVDGNDYIGGLVGQNDIGSSIANSYAGGSVYGGDDVGGLVGWNLGRIVNSYATGFVDGQLNVGGLVGRHYRDGSIAGSYWDTEASGISTSAAGTGKTTAELQEPTAATGIYSSWSAENWDFGSASQYPVLKDENGNLLSPALRYGLSRLRLSEGNLSPDFVAVLPNYTGTVVNTTNTIHLIPTAVNPAALIRIKSGEIHDEITSGSTSSEITLNTVGITTITIVVINSALTIKYNLSINYYRFSGDIDKDGDGLIEIDDLEGLNAIRYQADGTGYRKTSRSPKVTTGCPANGCIGYELTANLDLSETDNWLPINALSSVFEGNGHTISNLRINRPSTSYVGLFGLIKRGSEIKNIGLLNVDIKGNNFVGGLVGLNDRGSIANSYAVGTVNGSFGVGGLVGTNNSGNITNSYATGSVNGGFDAGGLVGMNTRGSIANSYAVGSVNGNFYVGGLVGTNDRGSIANSYADGTVNGGFSVGGLVGTSNSGSITNSYWDTDTSGISTSGGGTGKTKDALLSPTTATGIYRNWSTDNWDFGTSGQLPMLKYAKACSATTEEDISQPVCGALLPNQDAALGVSEVSPGAAIRIQVKVFLEGFL